MKKNEYILNKTEKDFKRKSLVLVLEGGLVGILTGLVVAAYRFSLTKAETLLRQILDLIQGNAAAIALWFLALILMGCLVARIARMDGMAAGSGLPQVTGEVKGLLDPRWWSALIGKFAGGVICILGGLSLGRGGPSIQLGAMAAKGYSRIRKFHITEKPREICLLSCGAGAGLAATFNAPLAGMMFALEVVHHTFDRVMFTACLASALMADLTAKLLLGQSTIFSYPSAALPLQSYWLLIALGILLGLAGAFFNFGLLKAQALFGLLKKVPKEITFSVIFLATGVLGLVLPQILAGGGAMSKMLEQGHPALTMLVFLLLAKFIFSVICVGSGAPGGIFFPLFILGSYLGAIFGDAAVILFAVDGSLWSQFIILGIAGLFAGIFRTPITGILLTVEMTGSMHSLLDIAIVSVIAYITANLTGSRPICDSLLDNFMKGRKGN